MSEEMNFTPNPGKNLIRAVDGVDYMRIPVKTHLITKDDDMADVVKKYPQDLMREGDILFISEKAVACTQCRAIPMEDIKPRKLAVTLSRYVTKTPAGNWPGDSGDYGDGPSGVRYLAHPLRRLLLGHRQAAGKEGVVLHCGRTESQRHRRPYGGHHSAL